MSTFGGVGVMIIIIMVLSLASFVITIMALIDVLKNEFVGTNKIVWVLLVVLLAPLGSVLYYFIGRRQKVVA